MEHKITNVIKLDSTDLNSKDYTLNGVLFIMLMLPKANSGISLGSVTTTGAILAASDGCIEIPVITGQWSPFLIKALRGTFSAYTFGSEVTVRTLYSNNSNYYMGNKNFTFPQAYDNTATYDVGDERMYSDAVYKCTTKIETAEDFDPTHWELVMPLADINDLLDAEILIPATHEDTVNFSDYDVYIAPIED